MNRIALARKRVPAITKGRLLAIFLLIGLVACAPEKITTQIDKDGVITQQPHIWKSSTSNGPRSSGLHRGYIVEDRGVLAVGVRESAQKVVGERFLQLKDLETGENLWVWDEFENKSIGTLRQSIGLYPGSMLLHDASTTYCINTLTGKTIWKTRNPELSLRPYPAFLGERYFMPGRSLESQKKRRIEPTIFAGDVRTGALKEIVKPVMRDEYAYIDSDSLYYRGSMLNMEAFSRNGSDYLVVPFTEPGPKDQYNHTRGYFGLYNLSAKKWVYERIAIRPDNGGASACLKPIVNGDKVYVTSLTTVGCFDLMTGKEIWRRSLSDMFTGFNDFILVEDKLLLNGDNATLYCVDANTGSPRWTQKASALTSDLYHQDGVVYYIYTKSLLAVDVNTGKLLWDMPSPDIKLERRHDSWFAGFVTGSPGKNGKKGKIFASTNYNVYCFEAAL
ncbi:MULTISPECIES: PQQ-binding-like beta-propeller repeat protein [Dyadobacter]|uniref:PQQ-binding-like beta-propeller repeat protein n=1 Tax=Dyadobacter chenhuakuii TaxID=2909339 RepID=A0ABY4XGU1_9BACT|nr:MULTISPECIES: PQQ-binding-like beta-propeller repeat protein [Dyadobacter]MCE7069041.1 PQQ-binding-like beta-propeller repeat protein [Dyadobacter sp. CY327]MCF2495423.1 PQQ-binding-like beta-propeller repeat protein [Dyadobacter chenhuakuii]MCF2521131.1 PQQ-binding-like beta-propeller repeat protein [Dyadobacter sp. CY351]USJ29461.1 PQQ-binding-like beta-propeller repeat protein [Dyadobacter chenhuakuii]